MFKCACGRTIELSSAELELLRAPRTFEQWRVVDAMKHLRSKCDSDVCRKRWAWCAEIAAEALGLELERVREEYEKHLEWLDGR